MVHRVQHQDIERAKATHLRCLHAVLNPARESEHQDDVGVLEVAERAVGGDAFVVRADAFLRSRSLDLGCRTLEQASELAAQSSATPRPDEH